MKKKNDTKCVISAATRTPIEQLAVLDQRLGKGVGALREREKLKKLIAEAK